MTLSNEVMIMNPSSAHFRMLLVALVTRRRIRKMPIDALAAAVEIAVIGTSSFWRIPEFYL